ncbi:MAG: GPW/gp25 family protein [Deltaproteobacteria bacterium]
MSRRTGHLAFPFRVASDGRTALVADDATHAKEELLQLLLTVIGERWYRPALGTNLRRLVFEGAGEATEGLTKAVVTQAVQRWLGTRVTLEELVVAVHETSVEVDVRYRLAGTEDSRVLRLRRSSV